MCFGQINQNYKKTHGFLRYQLCICYYLFYLFFILIDTAGMFVSKTRLVGKLTTLQKAVSHRKCPPSEKLSN